MEAAYEEIIGKGSILFVVLLNTCNHISVSKAAYSQTPILNILFLSSC
jgi:hypothetical protein